MTLEMARTKVKFSLPYISPKTWLLWQEEVVAMEGRGGSDGGKRWWRWREEVVAMEGGGGGDGGKRW